MKIICWNSRGIGGDGKMGETGDMVQKHNILLLGLVETKKKAYLNENIIRTMWGAIDFC